jgi:large subunit ribosomal protein L18
MKVETQTNRNNKQRAARRARVRRKVHGTAERPRLSIFRSNKFIYAQVIDDDRGVTLAAASSRDPEVVAEGSRKSVDAAVAVGKIIAARAKDANVERVVFDKGWYRYHGRIRSLADAVRESGLEL